VTLTALIAAALLASTGAPQEAAPRDPLLQAYVDELVFLRFGGGMHCNPRGEKRVLADAAHRLKPIRQRLVARFGDAAVAQAEAAVAPSFEEAWGGVSPGGCRTGERAERDYLAGLAKNHDASLDELERALGLSQKGHR
jgi:hypothetical protein